MRVKRHQPIIIFGSVAFALLLSAWPSRAQTPLPSQGALSFAERVACQQAIEKVYWQHRLWPKENPEPKPPFERVMPLSAIQTKVEDALRKSAALAEYWRRPITPAQLQAEIDRMARQTQRPELLRELWHALDDDPNRIAECLARPALADRLLRNWYASDERLHGALRAHTEGELRKPGSLAGMKRLRGEYSETVWIRADEPMSVLQRSASLKEHQVVLTPEEWDERTGRLKVQAAQTAGRLIRLHEDADRYYVTELLEESSDRLKVATVEWRKLPFDTWWHGARDRFDLLGEHAREASAAYGYRLPQISQAACVDDTWTPTKHILDPRYQHTAVWTGTEMIVWGGNNIVGNNYNDGSRYDLATDTWTDTSLVNAPAPRPRHVAVWTGEEMIIWGGADVDNSGGRYNPVTDTWQPTSRVNAPFPRMWHRAVWTGEEMIVWGGSPTTNTGGRTTPSPIRGEPPAALTHPRRGISRPWCGPARK